MKQKLVEDNMNLVYFLVNRYYPTFVTDEDIIQCGMMGLCRAANSWEEEKGTFSTFAGTCILNEICREFKRRSRQPSSISLECRRFSSDDEKNTLGDTLIGDEDVDFVDYDTFYNLLTPMDKEIVKYKQQGVTNKDIGKILGCSGTSVDKHLRKMRRIWGKVNGN